MTHCNPRYVRTNMLTLSAMIYNTARLGFEAQNAMAFRFLRLATRVAKSATPPVSLLLPPGPFFSESEPDDSPIVRAPEPVAHTRRASERKPIKKTAHHQKGSKKRAAPRRYRASLAGYLPPLLPPLPQPRGQLLLTRLPQHAAQPQDP